MKPTGLSAKSPGHPYPNKATSGRGGRGGRYRKRRNKSLRHGSMWLSETRRRRRENSLNLRYLPAESLTNQASNRAPDNRKLIVPVDISYYDRYNSKLKYHNATTSASSGMIRYPKHFWSIGRHGMPPRWHQQDVSSHHCQISGSANLSTHSCNMLFILRLDFVNIRPWARCPCLEGPNVLHTLIFLVKPLFPTRQNLGSSTYPWGPNTHFANLLIIHRPLGFPRFLCRVT